MATQIAVRVPDDLLDFIDSQVDAGKAESRADLVRRALERERHREAAEAEVEILAALAGADPYPDLAGFASEAAQQPMHID